LHNALINVFFSEKYQFREVLSMNYGRKDYEDVRETRSSLTSQEINYLKYLRLKESRKAHWSNQKYKIMT
jgi:hypothetical protein